MRIRLNSELYIMIAIYTYISGFLNTVHMREIDRSYNTLYKLYIYDEFSLIMLDRSFYFRVFML